MCINPRMYNTIFKKSVYFKTFAKGGGGGVYFLIALAIKIS